MQREPNPTENFYRLYPILFFPCNVIDASLGTVSLAPHDPLSNVVRHRNNSGFQSRTLEVEIAMYGYFVIHQQV
jgi:hypothetical protein